LALAILLAVQGLSTRTTGKSSTPARGTPGPLATAGPVLIWDGRRLVSNRRSAGHQIALSFDDGPDPRWTPRIAATLRRLGVPATFFVVGSEVARHPEVVRSLHRQGFELGNHTFTHADLAAVPEWERSLQIALTESAVAGAVGVRPPSTIPRSGPTSTWPGADT
jgi:peptidoglycan/xylan/chitin deacetylase (PgdA/CDA1 family)